MKLRELIFSQPHWDSKSLWDCIQMEFGGKMIYIQKLSSKETAYRDNLIRNLFRDKNKSTKDLSAEFGLSMKRIQQIVYKSE